MLIIMIELKQVGNDITLECMERNYYYIETEYVNFVEPKEDQKTTTSAYNYSHITNKQWLKILDDYTVRGVKAYQNTKVTLYGKMKVYQYKNWGWKGKKVISWYSGRISSSKGYSYDGKYYAKKQTIYYDNTPYNQVCR